MGVTQSAGLSLRWLKETFFAGQNYDELSAAAAKIPAGSEGLEWAPYLLGERTPHLDPEVRAAFAGISTVHTAAHFMRAVLEGVAYSLQDTFTLFAELGIPVSAIRLGGGGARGPLWRKIQAGIYGQAVEVLTAEEGGAFGCALMAGVGAGHWANLEEACGAGHRSGAAHRARSRRPGRLQGRIRAVAQTISGVEELAVGLASTGDLSSGLLTLKPKQVRPTSCLILM